MDENKPESYPADALQATGSAEEIRKAHEIYPLEIADRWQMCQYLYKGRKTSLFIFPIKIFPINAVT